MILGINWHNVLIGLEVTGIAIIALPLVIFVGLVVHYAWGRRH